MPTPVPQWPLKEPQPADPTEAKLQAAEKRIEAQRVTILQLRADAATADRKAQAARSNTLQLVFEDVCFIQEEAAAKKLRAALEKVARLQTALRSRTVSHRKPKKDTTERDQRRTITALRVALRREKRKTSFACPVCATYARRPGESLESLIGESTIDVPEGVTFTNEQGKTVLCAGFQFVGANSEAWSRTANTVETH